MRILNGIKWMCLFTVISGVANSDLILDNSRVITDVIGISISPTTGDIVLTTASKNYTVTQGGTTPPPPTGTVSITSFTSSPAVIDEGQSTLLRWTTTDATSCTATGGAGVANWAGTSIPLPNGSRSLAIASQGVYNFIISIDYKEVK